MYVGMDLATVLSMGFILGIKHAMEPDHVIAVSTIVGKNKKLWSSSLAGILWGIGHTATLLIVGLLFIYMKSQISERWAMSMELVVGIMLVYLGIMSVLSARRNTAGIKRQGDPGIPYVKLICIGFIHGLAGSAAMVLLTMATVTTMWEGMAYIMVFGIGTMVGMLLFTTVLGLPFIWTARNIPVHTMLMQLAGVVSVVFGFFYMYEIVFGN